MTPLAPLSRYSAEKIDASAVQSRTTPGLSWANLPGHAPRERLRGYSG